MGELRCGHQVGPGFFVQQQQQVPSRERCKNEDTELEVNIEKGMVDGEQVMMNIRLRRGVDSTRSCHLQNNPLICPHIITIVLPGQNYLIGVSIALDCFPQKVADSCVARFNSEIIPLY